MEMNEDGFLEELLALRRKAWETTPSSSTDHNLHNHEINGLFSAATWASISSMDGLDSSFLPNTNTTASNTATSSFDSFSSSLDHQPPPPPVTTTLDHHHHHHCSSFTTPNFYPGPFEPGFSGPEPDYHVVDTTSNMMTMASCKAEQSSISSSAAAISELEMENLSSSLSPPVAASFNGMEKGRVAVSHKNNKINKNNNNKTEGQPSKNLMAERRRRKRLNDRLSMLRSVVPKISKMDRTSILGDTIDYMKELLERINSLQQDNEVGSNNPLDVMTIFKDVKPNDSLVRNSPKFEVERRSSDTKLDICCAGKPGLLLSTVATIEAMGLEIQQCVISCFNDFSLQASCYEEMEQKSVVSSDDIKQALFKNAGYGGRCL